MFHGKMLCTIPVRQANGAGQAFFLCHFFNIGARHLYIIDFIGIF
jgi:hypothetical protein